MGIAPQEKNMTLACYKLWFWAVNVRNYPLLLNPFFSLKKKNHIFLHPLINGSEIKKKPQRGWIYKWSALPYGCILHFHYLGSLAFLIFELLGEWYFLIMKNIIASSKYLKLLRVQLKVGGWLRCQESLRLLPWDIFKVKLVEMYFFFFKKGCLFIY